VPAARLRIVGSGTMSGTVEALVAELPASVTWSAAVPTGEVAAALDAATVLVLPSRSEGLGRVVVEAFCRGRAVVGSRVGGIPDLVTDGETGLLVSPADAHALADALVAVLEDQALAIRLGSAAHATILPWLATPEDYARRIRSLVDDVCA
jgi:glycosyltransferase involved in cell wall biosynthesis